MARAYLKTNGELALPAPGETGHYEIAKRELGPAWKGDSEDAYAEMWQRGYVRIITTSDKVYAEQYILGIPTKVYDLTRAQRAWLEDQTLSGKQLFWNDKLFESTRDGRLNAKNLTVL